MIKIGGMDFLWRPEFKEAKNEWKLLVPFEVNETFVEIELYYSPKSKTWRSSKVYFAYDEYDDFKKKFPDISEKMLDQKIKDALFRDERMILFMKKREEELLNEAV
jgi:hypothetical protein